MPVIFQKFITRPDLRNNPDTLYVFGDNFKRSGLGGQAKQMRGEANAIGLVTKKAPTYFSTDFLTDRDLISVMVESTEALVLLTNHLQLGKTVVWPEDGIGTGRAKLDTNSQILRYYKYMLEFLQTL